MRKTKMLFPHDGKVHIAYEINEEEAQAIISGMIKAIHHRHNNEGQRVRFYIQCEIPQVSVTTIEKAP